MTEEGVIHDTGGVTPVSYRTIPKNDIKDSLTGEANLPAIRLQKEEGGSTTLTPPSTTLTDGGQRDVPPINDIQNNDIISLTGGSQSPRYAP